MNKEKWIIGLLLCIFIILPPVIILRSMMYGTNGTGIGILAFIYAGVLAKICHSFFDDYVKRFNNNWIDILAGIIFGFIPFAAIIFGLFLAGTLLNEKHVNKERHQELQTEVVDKVNNNREKFSTIDSLISAYRKVDPALSAYHFTRVEVLSGRGDPEMNKKFKEFERVYSYLKKDHENYKPIENDSITDSIPMLFWYCDENGGHMKDVAFQDFFNLTREAGPDGNEFKINVFADIDKLEAYIDSCEKSGMRRWNVKEEIKQCVNTLNSAKYMSIIKNRYLIRPANLGVTYTLGMLKADVYVWDFARHSFVDTLQVYTENSSQLKSSSPYYKITNENSVDDNLQQNLHHDLLKALKAKGY
jgi:hypothetical protein